LLLLYVYLLIRKSDQIFFCDLHFVTKKKELYLVCINTLVGKRKEERSFGREDENKMDLKEIGCEGVNWIPLARDSVGGS
jgi:hypothetical protein